MQTAVETRSTVTLCQSKPFEKAWKDPWVRTGEASSFLVR